MIKNLASFTSNRDKRLALDIIEHGLHSSLPGDQLHEALERHLMTRRGKIPSRYDKIYVIAIGKAADVMANVANSLFKVSGGLVIIPQGMKPAIKPKKFHVIHAGHPIPTKNSLAAATKIIEFLKTRRSSSLVIFLISGGTSSLVSYPSGISLKDKQSATCLLMKSGANIGEINCVRKHLSQIKGGNLLCSLKCDAVSFVMSDVIGDDLSVIASGITYCDKTRFSDAKRILLKYGLKNKVPRSVWRRIVLGTVGGIRETPKKPLIKNYVVASNRDCIYAMANHARHLGFRTKILGMVEGDVKDASSRILKEFPNRSRSCLVFGGETTVKVTGKGKGGRNQELVLNLLEKIQKMDGKIVVASVGTDGVDGNTGVAGAIVDSTMPCKPIKKFLKNNNSYYYFRKFGGFILTGYTHANLMDVGLVLRK